MLLQVASLWKLEEESLCQQSDINVGLTMGMSSGTSLRTVLGSSAFVLGVLTPHWMMFVDQAESW